MKINKIILMYALCISACTSSNNASDPKLELIEENPLRLNITNFHWSFSKDNHQAYGEFESLDHKVYDLLKGRQGLCDVYIEDRDTGSKLHLYGSIVIQFINNANDWQTWHYQRGIEKILLVQRNYHSSADTAKIDTVKMDTILVDTAKTIN